MKLSEFCAKYPIDWTKARVCHDGGHPLEFFYRLNAGDFLSFAKKDALGNDTRGLINALSNAKRAIDCQVDTVLSAIGYSTQKAKLEKQIGKVLKAEIEQTTLPQQPLTFKLLQSLGFLNPTIVDRTRKIRHQLEHQYQKPTKRQVSDAVEIAELFCRATERLLISFESSYAIGSGPCNFRNVDEYQLTYSVNFNSEGIRSFELCFWDKRNLTSADSKIPNSPKTTICPDDIGFFI